MRYDDDDDDDIETPDRATAPRLFKAIYKSSRVRIVQGPCEQVPLFVIST